MQSFYTFFLGIILLVLGIPIGDLLARVTPEELKQGKRWFNLLISVSLIFAVGFLLVRKDDLFFTMLFIAIVTSRSIIQKKSKPRKKRNKH